MAVGLRYRITALLLFDLALLKISACWVIDGWSLAKVATELSINSKVALEAGESQSRNGVFLKNQR